LRNRTPRWNPEEPIEWIDCELHTQLQIRDDAVRQYLQSATWLDEWISKATRATADDATSKNDAREFANKLIRSLMGKQWKDTPRNRTRQEEKKKQEQERKQEERKREEEKRKREDGTCRKCGGEMVLELSCPNCCQCFKGELFWGVNTENVHTSPGRHIICEQPHHARDELDEIKVEDSPEPNQSVNPSGHGIRSPDVDQKPIITRNNRKRKNQNSTTETTGTEPIRSIENVFKNSNRRPPTKTRRT
jgi:hypothetical protein